ncbi:hypothetical protein MF271_22655 (plasmid) [Deinococcus sp. KNUC1210]|uniref:hypothetical protein n=1 Tax=Deinococcus sp. KNUC1210 TaxID=2917691 RepID=UPI001EEF85B4|nr:hypothetical protein [Deinococcus sp. KNUC1210]ULH18268.1 hypothetical protein MF271_22655 [Deinococcus sp. KNUC1210]
MGYELMVYNLDLQSRAERIAALEPAELRRRSVKAAQERDASELWAIVEAYLVTPGGRGSRVSRHTLANYQQGLTVLLKFCETSGMSLLRPRPTNRSTSSASWRPAAWLRSRCSRA